jgi:glutathione peroxidase-family protein
MASIYIPSNSIYNLKGKTIDQNEFDFSSLEGKVSLIVNVACK